MNKIILLLFILFGLNLKSQEYKSYDFEKQVRNVFNDSSCVAMEKVVTEYLTSEPYYTMYTKRNNSIKIYDVQRG